MTVITMDKEFRGNAYIIKDGDVLLNYSGGFADLANEIPNTIDTRFASASMGKSFVAVGILQLIEAKKLGFEDAIGSILDFDLKQIDPNVTVRQLLNHTSGVPDYFDESVMDDYEALWTDYPNYRIRHNRDMLPLFIDKPMMYDRGEKFQYNNSGYVLLAMIIEKITGTDFDVYLKQNVFDRCGMSNTGYYSFDKLPAKCANSYIYCSDTDDYRTNIYSVGAKGTGDGGVFVTVGDIVKFWKGLIEHKLLSEKMVTQMFSKQSGDGKDPEEGYYGFGVWIIDNPHGQDYVYMQGCDDGISAISEYNPNNGMITVMLSNYGDNVWARMRKIREVFCNYNQDGDIFDYIGSSQAYNLLKDLKPSKFNIEEVDIEDCVSEKDIKLKTGGSLKENLTVNRKQVSNEEEIMALLNDDIVELEIGDHCLHIEFSEDGHAFIGWIDMYNDENYYFDNGSGNTESVDLIVNVCPEERMMCYDQDVLKEIVLYFCETGLRNPKYNWIEDTFE